MKADKLAAFVFVSIVIAVLLATALANFTRVSDSALAENATTPNVGVGSSRPSTTSKNYLPIIFLNSATAGGAWLLAGNAGTNGATDFVGTTDNMMLTFRVNNTIAYRIVPAVDWANNFAPNIIGGSGANSVEPGLYGATIAGGGASGHGNVISGTGNYTFIGGGGDNTAYGRSATIGGGIGNTAEGFGAFIGGGGDDGMIIAGNRALGHASTIGGGIANTIQLFSSYATIGGGQSNRAQGNNTTVAGGYFNTADGSGSTVGGGQYNTALGFYATIGGGNQNVSVGSTIGGGEYNLASGYNATISGGYANRASNSATVGGGQSNTALGFYATIGGGYFNTASGDYAGIGGGLQNTASGFWATIPGGYQNQATMTSTFAAGQKAQAVHPGTFVWADSVGTPLTSSADNQFLVRASGGITLFTGITATNGSSIAAGTSLYPGSGSWNNLSNKNLKTNFAGVDSRAILEHVNDLPVMTWNYKTQDESIRHIGPTAQDFYAAFKVGENDTTISTVDAQGVALAAIQGLARENRELKAQNANLEARVATLEAQSPASNPFKFSNLPLLGVLALLAVMLARKKM